MLQVLQNLVRYLFFLFFMSLSMGWSSELSLNPLSSSIKVINVFTGAPQPTDGPTKYAGFGDIAANLVSATEIKARYPDRTVRLIVTTSFDRIDPLIPTTDEIVKIMAPSLDPTRRGVIQIYNGVEVYFTPVNFHGALMIGEKSPKYWEFLKKQLDRLDSNKVKKMDEKVRTLHAQASYYWELFKLSVKLPNTIPSADLNVNFSTYPQSSPVLRVNGKLAIGVEEHYGDYTMVQDIIPKGSQGRGAFLGMASGPYSTGFMLTFNRPNREDSLELIRQWAEKNNQLLPSGEFLPQIAYSAGWQSIQVYLDALAQMELPKKELIVFVKYFPELNFSNLPKSVKVIPVKGLPHEVMSALIQESFYAPLVTGDISYGQALSTVHDGKSLVYESPEWKVDSAIGTKKTLAKDLNINPHVLDPMFLLTDDLEKLDAHGLATKATQVAHFLSNQDLQSKISKAIINRYKTWDIISNTFKVASYLTDSIGIQNLRNATRNEKEAELKTQIENTYNKNMPQCFKFYKKSSAQAR